jgi:hypothetical protein
LHAWHTRAEDNLRDPLNITVGRSELVLDHRPDHPEVARLAREDQPVKDLRRGVGWRRALALETREAALDDALGDVESLVDDLRGDSLQVLDPDHQLGQVAVFDAEVVSRVRQQGGYPFGR